MFRFASVLVLASLTPAWAHAHAPPQVARILWRDERQLVLVTNRGLMFGDVETRRFELQCNEALRVSTSEIPRVVLRADGALLAATSDGLFLTRDRGCSFEPVAPLVDMFVPALVQATQNPALLYAATFNPGQGAIRESRDGGATWSIVHALADGDYTRSLVVSPTNPELLYATGTELTADAGAPLREYVARSGDGGKTWQRSTVTLQGGELALLILAVNPAHGDELLVRAMSASPGFSPERLLISRDGGQSFTSPLTLLDIEAAAYSADGEQVWLAGSEGVFTSGKERAEFQRVGAAEHVTCAEVRAGEVFTCGHYAGNDPARDGIGRVDRAMGLFRSVMDFTDVTEAVACAPSSYAGQVCGSSWRDFRGEIFQLSDAGADGGATPDPALHDAGPTADAALDASASDESPIQPSADAAQAESPMGADAAPTRKHHAHCSARGALAAEPGAWRQLALFFAALAYRLRRRAQLGIGSRRESASQPRVTR